MKYLLLYPSEVTLFFLFVQKGQSTISWVLLCAFHFHDNGLILLGVEKLYLHKFASAAGLAFVSGNSKCKYWAFLIDKNCQKKQY